MDNIEFDSNNVVRRVYDQDQLLDVLIEIDAVLDAMDVYVYKNWLDGEIISGPKLSRYWVEVVLKFPYKKMPDPEAGVRLLQHGAKVAYQESTQDVPVDITKIPQEERSAAYGATGKRKKQTEKIWLVRLSIPRRFIEDMETDVIDIDDEEEESIDLTAAQTAEEEGLDNSLEGDEEQPQEQPPQPGGF